MKPIGGYFEKEELVKANSLSINKESTFSNGRSSLFYILDIIKPSKIYLPYYICDAILEPLEKCKIPYEFLPINNDFEFSQLPRLKINEYVIAVDYFGIKNNYINNLAIVLNNQIIVDGSQKVRIAKSHLWSFNSLRKFIGVPDGSIITSPSEIRRSYKSFNETNTSHLELRASGQINEGYIAFKAHEDSQKVNFNYYSEYTESVVSHLDWEQIYKRRIENYLFLQSELGKQNELNIVINNEIPLYYPFLPKKKIPHSYFWKSQVFVPILWTDCLNRKKSGFKVGIDFSSKLLPLPIDHRYSIREMKRIVELVNNHEK